MFLKNNQESPMRMQTPDPGDQPVRFYKFVALSFLALTIVLFAVVVFMSSKRAMITITTKSTPVDVTSDVLIGNTGASNGVDGMVTTTVLAISETIQVMGTREEPGIARGTVTLHNESAVDQPLVRTTRLLTEDGVLFRMDEAAVVPANGTIDVAVYADEEGKSGDIGPTDKFTIPGLNEVKQQVIYASSDEAMSGGVQSIGALAEEDIEKAKVQLAAKLEGDAASGFDLNIDEGTGVVYAVESVTATTDAEVGSEIDSFVLTGEAQLVAVTYSKEKLKAWGEEELNRRTIGDAENVTPGESDPKLTFVAYDADTGIASLSVFFDGLMTLNPESKQIEKTIFFGKTKDEVRRYLLSLDHVSKVEVELKPVWMQSVPHIHDHVTVILKEVE